MKKSERGVIEIGSSIGSRRTCRSPCFRVDLPTATWPILVGEPGVIECFPIDNRCYSAIGAGGKRSAYSHFATGREALSEDTGNCRWWVDRIRE